jgi:hypothetical protein
MKHPLAKILEDRTSNLDRAFLVFVVLLEDLR